MTEFIQLRRGMSMKMDDDDNDSIEWDGIRDDLEDSPTKSNFNEKEIKDTLFPRDYVKSFL